MARSGGIAKAPDPPIGRMSGYSSSAHMPTASPPPQQGTPLFGTTGWQTGSHIAQRHRFLQTLGRIARGNEFLTDVARVLHFHQGPHDRGIIDLLGVVQLTSPRIARRMNMANVLGILANAADNVAVHDLHMIDVEQQLEPWRA